jgi:hypothetical protein
VKTKYVRRVHSANPAPSFETLAGPRVRRLLSVFASLVELPRAKEHNSSHAPSMAPRAALSPSTRRRLLIPARRASARTALRRAKLFA